MIRAKSVDPVSYFVDIKNAATGVLITSFTLNALAAKLSKNQTLVLRGTIGGTGTAIPGSFLVNNY
ncbi:hypothetical protein LPB86_10260 [Pedobacter sp. MC2016-14]|uniref:hypothetical protein n=1 Tax=Pedobacter sp. MC2016-14 TaxID=2897327 RepID=UPI001E434F9B|nr:hypothetical protein [Pedobacter sp. MC2016-14]MCD0488616.1 hypothetical protein [Pedobacter sp. MC2016-14]